ncbi:hypothetical protein N0V82_009194 [Gnomoniopsis sp. IMI 355080]|nr:hypothetical protein N0V82_009194 [Gnomoniopsis sp. IMI 355080]
MVVLGNPTNVADFASAVLKGSKQYFTKRTLHPGGSGLYAPASYLTHPTLPDHTIYTPHPNALRADERLPVLVWANGMSLAWGLMFSHFLREIASHGYVVIANGAPGENSGLLARLGRLHQMPPEAMVEAVRWVMMAAGDAGAVEPGDVRAHVDVSRIALAGQSRGGLDAYAAAASLRSEKCIKTIGMFNSGLLFRSATTIAQVEGLREPVFYFLGGPADLAYKNAEQDWELLPPELPAWCGNLMDVGHMGTFYEEGGKEEDEMMGGGGGGKFGRAALDWLDAVLKGDEEAKRRMVEEYEREGWKVKSRNLESVLL